MDSQLNYLIARQRQAEFLSRAEQARLATDARAAVSAPSRRWSLGRLVATRRLWAAGLVAAAQPAGPPQECVTLRPLTLGKALCASSAAAEEPTDTLFVADGTRLLLRPIGSDDRDQLAALLTRFSPESRYRRFLSPKPEVTPQEIERIANVDHTSHEAIGAIDPRDGSIVGVGRYADRPTTADLAVEVADELQDMGIGTTLARCVVHSARANGFALLTATTLWENRPARALLRRLEFRARASHDGVVELELELSPPNVQPAEMYDDLATNEPRPAPHAGPLAEASGYSALCAHGMNSLTDRSYHHALARLRRG